MIKQLLISFLLLLAFQTIAQQKRVFIYATIKDKVGVITDAHIVNLQTKQGTFSNENGEFRILAKENDSLQVSSVGYETIFWIVKKENFGIQKNHIKLHKITIELDEVEVKKHYLLGNISSDIKKVPNDTIGNLVKDLVSEIKNMKISDIMTMKDDEFDKSKAPDMRKTTDPAAAFAGVGGSISLGLDPYAQKLKKQRKEINFKESLPKKLLSEFGEKFFFIELKIPSEKYHHFINYCTFSSIEELYKKGEILELITLLQKESITYIKTLPKNEKE